MFNVLMYFLVGGTVTTAIVLLEESGFRLLSGLATLMPVFTLIAYFFIGQSSGGAELSKHAEPFQLTSAIPHSGERYGDGAILTLSKGRVSFVLDADGDVFP